MDSNFQKSRTKHSRQIKLASKGCIGLRDLGYRRLQGLQLGIVVSMNMVVTVEIKTQHDFAEKKI